MTEEEYTILDNLITRYDMLWATAKDAADDLGALIDQHENEKLEEIQDNLDGELSNEYSLDALNEAIQLRNEFKLKL